MAKGKKSKGESSAEGTPTPAAPEAPRAPAEPAPEAGAAAASTAAAEPAEKPAQSPERAASADVRAETGATAAGSAVRTETRAERPRGRNAATFVVVGLLVAGTAAAWATWPILSPRLAELFGGGAAHNDATTAIEKRRADFETAADKAQEPVRAVADLEAERAKFTAQLDGVVKRLDALEQAVAVAKKMAAATAGTKDSANATLKSLSQRLDELEKGGIDKIDERLRKIEEAEREQRASGGETGKAMAKTVDDLAKRLQTVESTATKDSARASRARALILAVAQLRESLRGSGPFEAELQTLAGIGGDDTDVAAVVEKLKPLAKGGIPSVAVLAERFDAVAKAVSRRAEAPAGDGWVARTARRLSSLVTVRRIDGAAEDNSVDGLLARAEARLRDANLGEAVALVEKLPPQAGGATAPWLNDARTRLAVDEALARLHGRAIALLGPAKG